MKDFVTYMRAARGSLHSARQIEDILEEAGFTELDSRERWKLTAGEAYYVRSGAALAAFRCGVEAPQNTGLCIMGCHLDSPSLQLKSASASVVDAQLVIPVEVYGSPIVSTWIDRDLYVSGKVLVRNKNREPELLFISPPGPAALIPNLAMHLNRDLKNGATYNHQDHLKALCGPALSTETAAALRAWLDPHIPETAQTVLDAELWLLPAEEARLWGPGYRMLSAWGIDNQAGAFTILNALLQAAPSPSGQLALFMDHEEIGSTSASGAAGSFADRVIRRMIHALDSSSADAVDRCLSRSILISNDAAHARNPLYMDRHDSGYAPLLGSGPVVKKSAVRRYATEMESVAWLTALADKAGVQLQSLQNRSDIPAGSTIGPVLSARLSLPAIDIGIPLLAMHSIRETAHMDDIESMIQLLKAAFENGPDTRCLPS